MIYDVLQSWLLEVGAETKAHSALCLQKESEVFKDQQWDLNSTQHCAEGSNTANLLWHWLDEPVEKIGSRFLEYLKKKERERKCDFSLQRLSICGFVRDKNAAFFISLMALFLMQVLLLETIHVLK